MRPSVFVTLVGAAFATAAVAAPQSSAPLAAAAQGAIPAERCFSIGDVSRYQGTGDRTLIVRTRQDRYYRITFAFSCPYLARPDANLVLKSAGATSMVCNANDLSVTLSASGLPITCAVQSVLPMTAAEVSALPAKERP
jgi:hypothetical protein